MKTTAPVSAERVRAFQKAAEELDQVNWPVEFTEPEIAAPEDVAPETPPLGAELNRINDTLALLTKTVVNLTTAQAATNALVAALPAAKTAKPKKFKVQVVRGEDGEAKDYNIEAAE